MAGTRWRVCAYLLQPEGRAVSGADGDALVLGERHAVAIVHDQADAGRLAGVFHVVRLVDVHDHLHT